MTLRSRRLLCTFFYMLLLPCTLAQSQQVVKKVTYKPKFDTEKLVFSLEGGSEPNEGIVAVTYEKRKYYICDDGWDDVDATVLCKALGLGHEGTATQFGSHANKSTRYIISDVDCIGNENDLSQCHYRQWRYGCRFGEQAGVICRNKNIIPTETVDKGKCGYRPFDHTDLLNERERRSMDSIDKIVGGTDAQHGEYPWQVNVLYLGDTSPTHKCGAVIISEYWLLSAAHCFKQPYAELFQVIVGDHNKLLEDEEEQVFDIDIIINHQRYNVTPYDYDIALIKIKPVNGHGIIFNDFVQPACLPERNSDHTAGLNCLISGWGKDDNYDDPTILKGARVPILDKSKCSKLMNAYMKNVFTERMMCAGSIQGDIDSCKGDSGGPLACNYNGAYTVFGVTSWGYECAQPGYPGVYADVKYFLTWINANINNHSNNDAEKFIPYRK